MIKKVIKPIGMNQWGSDIDDIFEFDFSYISWGSDNDYNECNNDFLNARLFNINPFQFLGKGLCIIIDRLLTEKKILKTTTNKNLTFCRCILKLLLKDRLYWQTIEWTHIFDALLNVRGYCYAKLLAVFKMELSILNDTGKNNKERISRKIEERERLLIKANDDNDITLVTLSLNYHVTNIIIITIRSLRLKLVELQLQLIKRRIKMKRYYLQL